MKRIAFVVMNEMTTGTFVMFHVNGDMFIYQVFNMYSHPFHHEMSYYTLQEKQPQQLTICLAHLSLQVAHGVKKRVGRKG